MIKSAMPSCQIIPARVVRGHQVAFGKNGDSRFPGGTLKMQTPFFRELGLDLSLFHQGTLNISIAPWVYQVRRARHTFRNVKWHPSEPAEDFSFFDVRLIRSGHAPVTGLIYFPHPETKPEHFQQPDVLELLLPYVEALEYGVEISIEVPTDQVAFDLRHKPST